MNDGQSEWIELIFQHIWIKFNISTLKIYNFKKLHE